MFTVDFQIAFSGILTDNYQRKGIDLKDYSSEDLELLVSSSLYETIDHLEKKGLYKILTLDNSITFVSNVIINSKDYLLFRFNFWVEGEKKRFIILKNYKPSKFSFVRDIFLDPMKVSVIDFNRALSNEVYRLIATEFIQCSYFEVADKKNDDENVNNDDSESNKGNNVDRRKHKSISGNDKPRSNQVAYLRDLIDFVNNYNIDKQYLIDLYKSSDFYNILNLDYKEEIDFDYLISNFTKWEVPAIIQFLVNIREWVQKTNGDQTKLKYYLNKDYHKLYTKNGKPV